MEEIKWKKRRHFLVIGYLAFVSFVNAQDSYSPYAEQTYSTNVYWGDTHLHTNLSVDAYGMGNKSLTPDDAYRFSKGEAVIAHNGMKVRLHRPLDFLVIADHAENIGVMPRLEVADPDLLKTEVGKRWHKLMVENPLNSSDELKSTTKEHFNEAISSILDGENGSRTFFWKGFSSDLIEIEGLRQSVWNEVALNADRHNEPGRFTAFSGYEWTGNKSGELHRVVIFKDGVDEVTQVIPFSRQDSPNPEKLWDYLSAYEEKTSGEVLAIPHNSNLSKGEAFSLLDYDDRPLNEAYAKTRSRWEPLVEVTQIKGDSETHKLLSPTDEFADYETWNNWNNWNNKDRVSSPDTKKNALKPHEYARSALKLGLAQQAKLGVNPFKFGLIGSTDAHTSLATADEDNFWGKLTLFEPSPYRVSRKENSIEKEDRWKYSAAGYAGVWARENTRDSLFAAMKRKETYATTGPRMTVRFFGGWDYEDSDALKPDLAKIGYAKGVPMGGDLTNAPKDRSPTFLIRAVRDPEGANLDRVQVIKGWHDKQGELHEKIYNVALSDGRKENWRGKVKSVGNTVNIKDASYTNTVGDPELAVVWKDPNFNKDELAFYYVRVLEIPTPRWTAYDAKYFGLKNIPKEVSMVTQERAYTSPIWFTPSAQN